MFSYYLIHKITREVRIVFGRNWQDAVRRNGINELEWDIDFSEYEEYGYDHE